VRHASASASQGVADTGNGSGTLTNPPPVGLSADVRATTTDGNGKPTTYAVVHPPKIRHRTWTSAIGQVQSGIPLPVLDRSTTPNMKQL